MQNPSVQLNNLFMRLGQFTYEFAVRSLGVSSFLFVNYLIIWGDSVSNDQLVTWDKLSKHLVN